MESRVSQRRRMRDARTSRHELDQAQHLITRNALNRLTTIGPSLLSTQAARAEVGAAERQREGGGSPLSPQR